MAAMLQLPTAETFFGPRLRRSLGQQVMACDDVAGDDRWRTLAAETGLPIPYWACHLYGQETSVETPTETDKSLPILVHVRHGRWLAVCECGSAQHPSRLDPRFYCVGCRNRIVGGRYRALVWPKNPRQIETALLRRVERRRHWLPHETVSDLDEQTRLIEAMDAQAA